MGSGPGSCSGNSNNEELEYANHLKIFSCIWGVSDIRGYLIEVLIIRESYYLGAYVRGPPIS